MGKINAKRREYLMDKERNITTRGQYNMAGFHNINMMSPNISVTYHP